MGVTGCRTRAGVNGFGIGYVFGAAVRHATGIEIIWFHTRKNCSGHVFGKGLGRVEECLFLLVDGSNSGNGFPEKVLTGLPGIKLVREHKDNFLYVLFDPAATEYDAIIKSLLASDVAIRQFNLFAPGDVREILNR